MAFYEVLHHHRGGLGEAVALAHLHAHPLKAGDEAPGRGRAPHHEPPQGLQAVARAFQVVRQGEPDRGHPGGEGHPLPVKELHQGGGVQPGPGQDLFGPHQGGGVGQAPGVHVEHGDHRQDHVLLREGGAVNEACRQGVEDQSPVAVDHPLGEARGPRGVGHAAGGPLRHPHGVRLLPQGLLVGQVALRGLLVHDHEVLHRLELAPYGLHQGQEVGVKEEDLVLGVVQDVGDLLGGEAGVGGVEHRPHAGDGEVGLEVAEVVEAQGGHPVPHAHPEGPKPPHEPPGPLVDLGVGGAVDLPGVEAGDHLLPTEKRRRPLQKVPEVQLLVHHGAWERVHPFPLHWVRPSITLRRPGRASAAPWSRTPFLHHLGPLVVDPDPLHQDAPVGLGGLPLLQDLALPRTVSPMRTGLRNL